MANNPNKQPSDALAGQLKAAFQDTLDEGVPDEFRRLIDRNLKQAFDKTVDEGVPDRFANLLAELSRVANQGSKDD